jgi:hypothetical protein
VVRPAIATVTSIRPWERELAETARRSGLVRLVARCSDPDQLHAVAPMSDAVFIGSETPWLTVEGVRALAATTTVVAIVSGPSDPMVRLFRAAGVSELIQESAPAMTVLTVAVSAPRVECPQPLTPTITVTGARGAPGRTEVALALGWALGPATLVAELDLDAPSLGLRAGIPPRPPPAATPNAAASPIAAFGPISLFAPPVAAGPLRSSVVATIVEAARPRYDWLVLDAGPDPARIRGEPVVVCDPSPVGIVRCAALLAAWTAAPPLLVVNRTDEDTDVFLVRRATGLDPIALLPRCATPNSGEPPPIAMVDALAPAVHRLRSAHGSAA